MNTDIRLAVSFRGHRKRKRLRLLLGPGSTDYLIDLWISTAMNHPSGVLQGMDATDIALESGWEGEPQAFVTALIECGFLEQAENSVYALHDWAYHQGYVVHAEARRQKAKRAAEARWEIRNAPGTAQGNAQAETGNAPLPAPAPLPDPSPVPVPEPSPVPKAKEKTPLPVFAEDSGAYQLAVIMRDTLKANVPTLREPNLQKWAHSFGVALRNDERMKDPQFVAAVIRWACSDIFWRANIQSPDKLREKFDQLTAKMEAEALKARTPQAGQWKSPAQRRLESNQEACREAERLLFGKTAQATAEMTYDA